MNASLEKLKGFLSAHFSRIFAGLTSVVNAARRNSGDSKNFLHKLKERTDWTLLLLPIPIAFFFWFGTQHLGQFETADEYRWFEKDSRIPTYWNAMENRDWKTTAINDKPGVMTAIVSGLGMKHFAPDLSARTAVQNKYSSIADPTQSEVIDIIFRLPLLFFNAFLSILWYFQLRRLFEDGWTAVLSVSLILLSPILIGVSQIVNPDALLWSTTFTSALAFLLFLKKTRWYDLLTSGIFFGFALLSKYTAVMLLPFAFGSILVFLSANYNDLVSAGKFRRRAFQFALFSPLFFVLGVLVYALLMPAVFLQPEKILLRGNDAFKEMVPYLKIMGYILAVILVDAIFFKSWILKKILWPTKFFWKFFTRSISGSLLLISSLIIANYFWKNFWQIPDIQFDAGRGSILTTLPLIQQIFIEALPFLFSLTPIALLLLLLTWLNDAFGHGSKNSSLILALASFLLIFYISVISVGFVATIRYSIMLYPFVLTIAAVGIMEIIPRFRFQSLIRVLILVIAISASILSLQKIQPFYFNYANDLLPKDRLITGAWGYGGHEAAQFVNSRSVKPKNLIVWTDYGGFCSYFYGLCIKDSDVKWIGEKTVEKIDYYIVTRRGSNQLSRTWSKLRESAGEKPEWELLIDGRPENFIQVYKNIKKESSEQEPSVPIKSNANYAKKTPGKNPAPAKK